MEVFRINPVSAITNLIRRVAPAPPGGCDTSAPMKIEPVLPLPNRLLQKARIVSSREDILKELPKELTICEVGTAYGDFAQKILDICRPSKLIVIDTFIFHSGAEPWGPAMGRESRLRGASHMEYFQRRFESQIGSGLMRVMPGHSPEMLPMIPDQSVDVFYVDAAHEYQSVRSDLSIIKRKIRRDGWIILNDYVLFDVLNKIPYGVIQATNEFMLEEEWEMYFFAFQGYMFCDVAIKKVLP
jgi:hypothetical protein